MQIQRKASMLDIRTSSQGARQSMQKCSAKCPWFHRSEHLVTGSMHCPRRTSIRRSSSMRSRASCSTSLRSAASAGVGTPSASVSPDAVPPLTGGVTLLRPGLATAAAPPSGDRAALSRPGPNRSRVQDRGASGACLPGEAPACCRPAKKRRRCSANASLYSGKWLAVSAAENGFSLCDAKKDPAG